MFALINFGIRTVHQTMPNVLGYATDIHVEQLLSSTNNKREELKLTPFTLNEKLSNAAAQKAQDMFANNYWAHNSPQGKTPWDFITGNGYAYVVAGENLAKNFSTSQAVVDAWMDSVTHRDNIVKPTYRDIGFAVVNGILNGEETTLVVQMFGSTEESLAQAPKTTQPIALNTGKATVRQVPAETVLPHTEYQTAFANNQGFTGTFLGVTKTPLINIPTLTHDIVFVFTGILLGVMLIDAWVVRRKKVVRVAGHNTAHILFLCVIVILAGSVGSGSLL